MTKIKNNVITTGLSGKLGKQIVFRQWSGDTFLAKAPVRNQKLADNELRTAVKLRFKKAVVYAKKAIDDAELKKDYQSKCKVRQNAYNRAVQDFYDVPNVEEIDLSNYTGEPDSVVRIYATEDFRVSKVQVRIENQKSEPVETGFAKQEGNTNWWRFIATVSNPLSEGGKIIASAYDLPGNETIKEMTI